MKIWWIFYLQGTTKRNPIWGTGISRCMPLNTEGPQPVGPVPGPKLMGAKLFWQDYLTLQQLITDAGVYITLHSFKQQNYFQFRGIPTPFNRCLHALTYRPSPVGSHDLSAPRWGQARTQQLPFSRNQGSQNRCLHFESHFRLCLNKNIEKLIGYGKRTKFRDKRCFFVG